VRPDAELDEDDVRDYCRERMAHFKVPRYVMFVDEFPMTITGKIQKFVMRDAMKRELGLDEDATA
jgi:fatty-acyl-CoA synthase